MVLPFCGTVLNSSAPAGRGTYCIILLGLSEPEAANVMPVPCWTMMMTIVPEPSAAIACVVTFLGRYQEECGMMHVQPRLNCVLVSMGNLEECEST